MWHEIQACPERGNSSLAYPGLAYPEFSEVYLEFEPEFALKASL